MDAIFGIGAVVEDAVGDGRQRRDAARVKAFQLSHQEET